MTTAARADQQTARFTPRRRPILLQYDRDIQEWGSAGDLSEARVSLFDYDYLPPTAAAHDPRAGEAWMLHTSGTIQVVVAEPTDESESYGTFAHEDRLSELYFELVGRLRHIVVADYDAALSEYYDAIHGSVARTQDSTTNRLLQVLKRELRFFWNLVDPRHGKSTVAISRETGEVVGRTPAPAIDGGGEHDLR